MPVRSIPRNYRTVTGTVPVAAIGRSVAFESPLERDFYILIDFDDRVESVEEQPLQVVYLHHNGANRRYTPDALVIYKSASGLRPTLFEIKGSQELVEKWDELEPRFRAAHRYCKDRGWRFRIMNERRIRSPFLDNAKLLRRHRSRNVDELVVQRIRMILRQQPGLNVAALLLELEDRTSISRGHLLPVIWHLLATKQVDFDMKVPITLRTMLFPLPDSPCHRGPR